jgi:hypothetical protein
MMRSCGIFSALLLTILAVPALAISVLFHGIAQTILVSPSFVASLDSSAMNERYVHIAPYLVQHALTTSDTPDSMGTRLFPDDTTRATIQIILPQTLAMHTAEPALLLTTFDANLATIITQTLRALPPCAPEAERAIDAILDRNQLPVFDCAPANAARTQRIIDVARQLQRQAFSDVMTSSELFRYTSQDIANQLNTLRAGANQLIILPATLIIMIVAFAVRSRRQLFGWISSIFIATAGVGVLLSLWVGAITTPTLEAYIIQELTPQAGVLLPVISAINDSAFAQFLAWSIRTFLIIFGGGIAGILVAAFLPQPINTKPRTSQPLGPQSASVGDGSTNRVKTDYETDAIIADPQNTLQLPPGLDTSKLTFGRRMPKIPQPTQQITTAIPKGDHTSPIPVSSQTEHLEQDTNTQELGPQEDSRAKQRTDEHRF